MLSFVIEPAFRLAWSAYDEPYRHGGQWLVFVVGEKVQGGLYRPGASWVASTRTVKRCFAPPARAPVSGVVDSQGASVKLGCSLLMR